MKSTTQLQSAGYILLFRSFKEWLETLGYSPLSIPALTLAISHFLKYQESNHKPSIDHLAATDANNFITHMQDRKQLSSGHINKQIQALQLFSKYLRVTGRSNTGFVLERLKEHRRKPVWLSIEEIKQLYTATADSVLGMRDRAMLTVYYGCGLRLHEGACLELKDIISDRKLLHVRKGKHYKERFVPVTERNYEELKLYMDVARPQLLQDYKTEALFIDANKGRPMQKQSLYVRIRQLTKRARLKKKVGMHTLRHSIATHLLQSGMPLEQIQAFLGHGDLDSTQLYTHLVNDVL
jgi:integrase/recombinase XerD